STLTAARPSENPAGTSGKRGGMASAPILSRNPQAAFSPVPVRMAANPSENALASVSFPAPTRTPLLSMKPYRSLVATGASHSLNRPAQSNAGGIDSPPDASTYPHLPPASTGARLQENPPA